MPERHIFLAPHERPKSLYPLARVYFRKWLVHPIKRRLARYYLMTLQRFFGLEVVGITGSSGKTTTKEMAASILRQVGETVASFGNIDPIYNIPTTILKCRPNTKFLVLEMGVEYEGEMDFYLWLAKPHVGVINNISQTHTLYLKNIEGVLKEKGKLVKELKSKDFAILNHNDSRLANFTPGLAAKIVWIGESCAVFAKEISVRDDFKTHFLLNINSQNVGINLPALGEHFVENALAAAAVAFIFDIPLNLIKAGLETFKPPEHRLQPISLANGILVLDDSYNSNPLALRSALNVLSAVAKSRKKIAVLGDMLELGDEEIVRHQEIASWLQDLSIKDVIGVGFLSRYFIDLLKKSDRLGNFIWVEDAKKASIALEPLLISDSVVLVKGSRAMKLDYVVEKLVTKNE